MSPDESSRVLKLRDFPLKFRIFSFRCTLPPSRNISKGLGPSSWRRIKLAGWRYSRRSIPDIACFIYGLGKALGLLVPKTWGVRTPGKKSRSRSHAIPLMELGTRSIGHSGHIPRSRLLQKRSHQGKALPRQRRSGHLPPHVGPNSPGKHWRLVGLAFLALREHHQPPCQVNAHLTFAQSCNSAPSLSMNHLPSDSRLHDCWSGFRPIFHDAEYWGPKFSGINTLARGSWNTTSHSLILLLVRSRRLLPTRGRSLSTHRPQRRRICATLWLSTSSTLAATGILL